MTYTPTVHATYTNVYTIPYPFEDIKSVYVSYVSNDELISKYISFTRYWQHDNTGLAINTSDSCLLELHDTPESTETVYVMCEAYHPKVNAYSDAIDSSIPVPMITLLVADKLMQWHGVTDANANYANKIQAELAEAKRIAMPKKFSHGTRFLTWVDS